MISWYRVSFSGLFNVCTGLLLEADEFVFCGKVVEFYGADYVDTQGDNQVY